MMSSFFWKRGEIIFNLKYIADFSENPTSPQYFVDTLLM